MWEGIEPRIEKNLRKQAAPLRRFPLFRVVGQRQA
jgi:hypothetical protein